MFMLLIHRTEWQAAIATLDGSRDLPVRPCADALIEDKAFALVVSAAALFEVAEDAAIKHRHVLKSTMCQKCRCLLAPQAARTDDHDRLLLQRQRQITRRNWKFMEVRDGEG